jgi:hypothetical protein
MACLSDTLGSPWPPLAIRPCQETKHFCATQLASTRDAFLSSFLTVVKALSPTDFQSVRPCFRPTALALLAICLSVRLSPACLSIRLSVRPPARLSVRLSTHPPGRLPSHLLGRPLCRPPDRPPGQSQIEIL